MKANRRVLPRCQWEVAAHTPEGFGSCDEAAWAVWDVGGPEPGRWFYVCEVHDTEMDRLDDEASEQEGK